MVEFVNIIAKNVQYIIAKDEIDHQRKQLIYETNFKKDEETMYEMAWISLLDLLPTFLGKNHCFQMQQQW